MIEKRQPYRNKKILNAAKGEECTVGAPCCNYNPQTTVAAHFNEGYAGKGAGQKADDCAVVFACSDCHDFLDGRNYDASVTGYKYGDKEWYWRRAYYRTIRRLIDLGVLE